MKYREITFIKKNIVEIFRAPEFMAIPKEDLMDFLPRISPQSPAAMAALRGWTSHFRDVKVPYAVTETFRENGITITLWKQYRIKPEEDKRSVNR